MAYHRLTPADDGYSEGAGEHLAVGEILERLKREFGCVLVDRHAGRTSLEETVQRRKQLAADGKNPFGTSLESQIEYFKSKKGEAVMVLVADSEDYGTAYLSTLLTPDTDIIFGYSDRSHYEEAKALVPRFANAIGYEVEEG